VLRRIKARAKDRLRRAVATGGPGDEVLAHVVIAGGTLVNWMQFSSHDWSRRLDDIVKAVEPEGVRWITLVPISSGHEVGTKIDAAQISSLNMKIDKALRQLSGRVDVIVRPEPDGRQRFVDVVNSLGNIRDVAHDHASLSEGRLARALMAPAEAEPDLVLILGRPTELPSSLVWELAYSELVFLHIDWRDLSVEHLQMAVDDFRRRNRRFGGIDA